MNPRQTRVTVEFKKKKFQKQIAEYLESFSYTDCAAGESDSIEVRVSNKNKVWSTKWIPERGDVLTAKILQKNWRNLSKKNLTLKCGTFYIDELTYSGKPLICNMGAVSCPIYDKFNTQELTRTWENTSIKQIAEKVAADAGLKLYYDAEAISIFSVEQTNQTNCSFISSLCTDYGLAMKIFSNKIVILDEEKQEAKAVVMKIKESETIKWSYNETMTGVYTGAKFEYTNPDNDQTIQVNIGGGERIKNISVSANTIMEAQLKGIAAINNENKNTVTATITIPADSRIYAGTNVQLTGFGKMNGKYYVNKVKHSIASGYTMTLTLRKVQTRIKSIAMEAIVKKK